MTNSEYPFSLSGKIILITGASSGIGRSIAIECSKLGATLILTGRNPERLRDTMTNLKGNGHISKVMDLNDFDSLSSFAEEIQKLDGIVYSAGIQKICPAKFIHREDLNNVFETNLFSGINLNSLLQQKKKLKSSASIVFISSIAAGIVAEVGNAIYSASKGAILSFAKVLALELAPQKIRVNCVLPGMIKTPLLNSFSEDINHLEMDEKRYPFGYGEPSDVAFAAIYLLSNASKWVTGTEIILDGGLTLK